MAEEKIDLNSNLESAVGMSHDDMSVLDIVLHQAKGSSASSATLLQLEEMRDE